MRTAGSSRWARVTTCLYECVLMAVLTWGLTGSSTLAAQVSGQAVVRVRVTENGGAPLPGADLTVLRNSAASMIAKTDGNGRHTFVVDTDSARLSLAVRKLGYTRTVRLLPVRAGDTMSVELPMVREPVALDPIRTTEEQIPSKNYFLNGDEIMASSRGIFDAVDALRKLRPNMLGDVGRTCLGVHNIWINGRREFWIDPMNPDKDPFAAPHPAAVPTRGSSSGRVVSGAAPRLPGRMPSAPKTTAEVNGIDTVLSWIKSEHIAEMRYASCWDMSAPEVGTNDALYIVLRPGVKFEWGRGTYMDSSYVAPRTGRPPR
jgi:hypothetical protein